MKHLVFDVLNYFIIILKRGSTNYNYANASTENITNGFMMVFL